MQILKCIYAMFLVFLLPENLYAAVFSASFTVSGTTKTEEYSSAAELFENFDLEDIQTLFPSYTGTQQVAIAVNFRGVPINLSSPNGSTTVTFSIPDIDETKSFTGATRDDSIDLLDDYLEQEGGELLSKFYARLAEVSPHDRIAGNPASLMANMVSGDFDRAVAKEANATDKTGPNSNLVGIGISARTFDQDGKSAKVLSMPLSYTVKFYSDPRKRLIFSFPLNYYEVEESEAYSIPSGVTYRFPVNDNWYLAPGLGLGITASPELGSGGILTSMSLTSTYTKKEESFRWGVGNMFGNYKTQDLKVGDVTVNPDIQNQVLRNGVFLSRPHNFFWRGG